MTTAISSFRVVRHPVTSRAPDTGVRNMDWQDELRRLDKKLSEGEISAQDYRRMRDELLAEASAPAQGRGVMWAASRPEVTEPATAPPASPPAATPDAEETQIVADTTVTLDDTVVQG